MMLELVQMAALHIKVTNLVITHMSVRLKFTSHFPTSSVKKEMKILVLLLSVIIIGINSQLIPTQKQIMCFTNFIDENMNDSRVINILQTACVDLDQPDDLQTVCTNTECVAANQAIYFTECGFDMERGYDNNVMIIV